MSGRRSTKLLPAALAAVFIIGCDPRPRAEPESAQATPDAELKERLAAAEARVRELETTSRVQSRPVSRPEVSPTPGGLDDAVVQVLELSVERKLGARNQGILEWTVRFRNRSESYAGGRIVIFFIDSYQNILASDECPFFFLEPFEHESCDGETTVAIEIANGVRKVSAEVRLAKPNKDRTQP